MNERITQSKLMDLLDYDPDAGIFRVRAARRGLKARLGDVIGTYSAKDDALITRLDGRTYQLHNLAWLWVYGEWPDKQLLKLDGNGRNVAIANLALPSMASRGELTQERLASVLSYSETTGVFVWKIRPAKNVKLGSVAGKTDPSGHRIISVDGVDYTAQRLAWLYVNGELPSRPLRFLDGDKQNLAIANLALPEHDARTPDGRRDYERNYRQRRFEVVRAAGLRKDFGMPVDVYQHLFVKQGGVCACCKQPETAVRGGRLKWLAVDHCHDTNIVRGLLCSGCNQGIGYFKDDPARLRAAADYIEKSRVAPAEADNVIRLIARKAS